MEMLKGGVSMFLIVKARVEHLQNRLNIVLTEMEICNSTEEEKKLF